ncbi:hypothetical protein FACS189491_09410 [Spirochaetia bacterium]|nr:hypothetical protein FACS189491_09410 [Spirochaetia bacterium]
MLCGGLRTKNSTKQSLETMPLITVVTVVRNGEKTLEETILSVINQTYTNIEYIIVDGASTDGTLDIIKKYEDLIDYWMSEPDEGIYDAMNKGIDLATGEWINFMNGGDCFYANSVIDKVIASCHIDMDVFYGDIAINNMIYKSPERVNTLFFLMERTICHQLIFMRRSFLSKYPFDTQYRVVADRKSLMQGYFCKRRIEHIPVVICLYDKTKGSATMDEFNADSYRLIYEYFGFPGVLFAKTKRLCRKLLDNLL